MVSSNGAGGGELGCEDEEEEEEEEEELEEEEEEEWDLDRARILLCSRKCESVGGWVVGL